jgi:hypothetical protein
MYALEDVALVGSVATVNGKPHFTAEEDYLVLPKLDYDYQYDLVKVYGYVLTDSIPGFHFYQKESSTSKVIIAWSRFDFDRFCLATEVCKRLNFWEKMNRIKVHKHVLGTHKASETVAKLVEDYLKDIQREKEVKV